MKELEKTYSVCPVCFYEGKIQKIDASVIEDEEKIWIIKHCQKHGSFKEIYFGDVQLYKKWMKYKVTSKPVSYVKTSLLEDPKLYEEHTSQTMLTNLVITNRTNLYWDKNNFNAHLVGYVYEPSLNQLRELMQQTRDEKPIGSKSLQITGGEPTLRGDFFDIIRLAKEIGFSHVQIHTNGLKLAENIDFCQRLKDEKVNTVYLNFDGITNTTNPLIEENKTALENLRKVDLNVVLVSNLIGNKNVHESGKIIRFALNNIDVVRGIHFQPIFFYGVPPTITIEQRESQRVDLIQWFNAIEKELYGIISRDDFYPTSVIYPISQLIEMLINEPQVKFTPHPGCGGSTLIILEEEKPLPITRFINVDALIDFIDKESKKQGPLRKLRFASALVNNIDLFTNNSDVQNGFDLKQIAKDAAIGGSDFALRKYHHKTLIIGSTWYQDIWNLNIDRLQRCVVHCPTFEGLVPFCSYAGLGYGKKIQKKYSIPIEEWEKITGKNLKDDFQKNNA